MNKACTIQNRTLGVRGARGELTCRVLAGAAAVLLASTASQSIADSVTLKPAARVAGDRVTLAEIAELDGAYAQSLGATVVMEDLGGLVSDGSVRLTIEQLRSALDQADPSTPVRWGVLSLTGGEVVVRRRAAVAPAVLSAEAPQKEADGSQTVEALPSDTVRWHIGQRLRQILGVSGEEIRLRFEPGDKSLLDTPTSGRVVEVSINAKGGTAPASVKVFEADRLVTSGTAKVEVEVRREAVVATSALSRGDLVGSSDLQQEQRWMAPDLRAATMEDARGSEVRTRLAPGKLILLSDIESPIIVKRGDLVNVHVHAGSIALKTTARAKSNGRVGDVVTFESLTDKKQTYRARMSGPGTAVALTPEEESRMPERSEIAAPETQAASKPEEPAKTNEIKRLPKPTPEQSRAAVGGVVVERRANADGTESLKVQPPDPTKKPRTLKFFPVDE